MVLTYLCRNIPSLALEDLHPKDFLNFEHVCKCIFAYTQLHHVVTWRQNMIWTIWLISHPNGLWGAYCEIGRRKMTLSQRNLIVLLGMHTDHWSVFMVLNKTMKNNILCMVYLCDLRWNFVNWSVEYTKQYCQTSNISHTLIGNSEWTKIISSKYEEQLSDSYWTFHSN